MEDGLPNWTADRPFHVGTEYAMLVVLISLTAALYISSAITVIRWNDPAGYKYAGLRIAETGRPTYHDVNNVRVGPYFTLHAFKVKPNQGNPDFYPNYSIGLPLLLILAYNAVIFGGPFSTGYSPKHGWVPWSAFSWRNFLGQSPVGSGGYRAVLSTLWTNFHVGSLLALLGLCIMPRSTALLVGGNVAIFSGLYAFYLWPPTELGTRFLLFPFAMLSLMTAFLIVRVLDLVLKDRSYFSTMNLLSLYNLLI